MDVTIPPQGLEDPYWLPKSDGFTVKARPGKAALVEFPVIVTGEIDGMVYVRQGGSALEVADVAMELIDADGNLVAETRSAFDGFFLFEGVPYGEYSVRMSELSAQAVGMNAALGRRAFVTDENDIVRLGTIAIGGPVASTQ